ncbi:2',3'-cyclic-nucleotide 2'-phosphodiesterase/3'-nucleotidase [Saccharothrix coeruleofusca]|uniref:bifunctional metallophosphatase/5'-nucleotidase n=1 Tax=Saccharothrix coeruleofusca TaxID=33919 RepID=UPI001AE464F4|nr:5'-nucleotidase C-terminal domain-containing protein [Saccharothrix coeruleofusca]MBP2335216.1 2',3'-cyclic-nucleotide 2'-phosphodiesterase/3'-nucleotidase [Saccharothrix coeruleofusca]
MTGTPLHRRALLAGGAAGVLAAAGFRPATASAAPATESRRTFTLTVLGTTDLHGNVFNWDYYADREFDDSGRNDVGLAKISTLVQAVREERGAHRVLLLDAGDTIQGTPLAYYYAKVEPIGGRRVHPMAAAMNAIGYDAAALGNHEFNYGIPLLRQFEKQLDFPLLAANALDAATGRPAFRPYVIKTVWRTGGPPLRVGVLGLTNPGIAVWDKANVEGRMTFPGLLEQAREWVPAVRRAGADLVVVAAHSGADLSSSLGDQLPFPENCAALVAEEVPGIDAILVGHAHQEIAQRFVTNKATGRQVLLTEPLFWGKRLSLVEFDLEWAPRGGWRLRASRSQVLNSNTVPEDPRVVRLLRGDHDKVVAYVNSKVGTCKATMSGANARYEDTAALDFINHVQAAKLKESLGEGLPVLSLASPFNRAAAIPAGDVSVRDVAGLYTFDNTLYGVRLTGAQIKDYLERSASYFQQVTGPGPHAPDALTNANGTPDYLYDVLAGLDAPLTYDIDIARPVGSRIANLAYGGAPVAADQAFAVAVNNYRQSGGGNFPHIAGAPVLHNQQLEIRQLLIEWVRARGEIDPAAFASTDWRLVADGQPVVFG